MEDFNANGKRFKDEGTVRVKKQSKSDNVELDAIIQHARKIWGRDKENTRAIATEDRDFREMFGCGAQTACILWQLLSSHCVLPIDGRMEHYLWTLMFLKIYAKERTLCTLAGGVDKKTFRKWIWSFIPAIADLEEDVVSIWLSYIYQNHIPFNI